MLAWRPACRGLCTSLLRPWQLAPATVWLRGCSTTATDPLGASPFGSLREFLQQERVVLVDVRSTQEYALGSAKHARNIPVQDIPDRMHDLPEQLDAPLVVFCAAGKRAALAKTFLQQVGYANVVNGGSVGDVLDAQSDKSQIEA